MRRSGPFKSMRFTAYRHFEKVPGQMTFRHHLLEFVICKPVSDASLASLLRETHPEGADLACLSPSPSEGGIYSFLKSRRNSRKCDSFRRSVAEKDVPQRQQIAENGAVVERDCRGNAAQKACSKGEAEIGDPQRQRIAEFAAVAVPGKDSRVSGTFLGGVLVVSFVCSVRV